MDGARTKMPQKPKITLGIPARSSTKKEITGEILFGRYWETRIAMAKPSGTPNRIASAEEIKVPAKKTTIPYEAPWRA